MKSVQEIKAE
nr:hypothetical protein [Tanacetum cinerariifolium]